MQEIIDIIFAKCKIYIDALFAAFVSIPVGTVIMWTGLHGDIPDGWQSCDGTNGTPDLRGLFVRAAGDGHPVDETGGSATHTHGPGTNLGLGKARTASASNIPPYWCLWYIQKM